jgi:hypothetical protein
VSTKDVTGFTLGLGAVASGGYHSFVPHRVSKPMCVHLGFVGFRGIVGLRLPVPRRVSKPTCVHLETLLYYRSHSPDRLHGCSQDYLFLYVPHRVSKPMCVHLGFVGFRGIVGLRHPVPRRVSKPTCVHLEIILSYRSHPPDRSCGSW